MANDLYTKELRKVMTNNNPPSSTLTELPKAEIEARIAAISAELKGSMHMAGRIWLVEERIKLRNALSVQTGDAK